METIEAEWLDLTITGSSYEEQMDVRADPKWSEERRYRHRPVSFTGQHVEWTPGRAPK